MILRLATLKLLAATVLGPAIALAQPPPERDGLATIVAIENTLVGVIDKVEPSVVAISRVAPDRRAAAAQQNAFDPNFGGLIQLQPADGQPSIVATGVIIDPAGLVLTEFLAIREGDIHTVTTTDGVHHRAEIRAADPRSGLAILALQPPAVSPQTSNDDETTRAPQSPTIFPAIRLGDAAELRKGQFVVAIGNPYAIHNDGEPSASWGIVTNLAQKAASGTNLNDAPGPGQDYRTTLHHLGTLIQTDAKLGWNAGGGALVNLQGELIGLTTTAAAIAGHEHPAGYAIPINATFRRIIETLKDGREVEYGLLGVGLVMSFAADSTASPQRVTVQHAVPGSPGARAGLMQGDVITRVGGRQVDNVDQLQLTLSMLAPSSATSIEYERDGKATTAQVTLAKLGVAGNKVITNLPPDWRGIRVDYATALDPAAMAEAIAAQALDVEGCVLVSKVEANSVAWREGIRPGMFISHVGEQRVSTPDEFYAAVETVGDSFDIRLTQPIEPSEVVEEKADEQVPDIQLPQP